MTKEQYEKAINFASKVHEGQVRDSGEPYITHPLNGSDLLLQYGYRDFVYRIVTVLHDTIEDCKREDRDAVIAGIEAEFGVQVLELVQWLTNQKNSNLTRLEQKTVDRLMLAKAPKIAKVVKLVDRLNNVQTMEAAWEDWRVLRYIAETRALVLVLKSADPIIANQILDVCTQVETNMFNKKRQL